MVTRFETEQFRSPFSRGRQSVSHIYYIYIYISRRRRFIRLPFECGDDVVLGLTYDSAHDMNIMMEEMASTV